MKDRRFFITLEVENMEELQHIEAFVRDVLNKEPHDSAPPASRASGKDPSKFYCSNPECGKEITKTVYDFRDKDIKVPLCMDCQAVVRNQEA